MTLELQAMTRREGAAVHIHETTARFEPGSFNVLLGATRAGKTTLLQLMAGILKPTSGKIFHNGKDVTNVSVQQRNVSMVYQQFINYPMMNVFENIASPLRVSRMPEAEVKSRVGKAAELLRLGNLLDRKPNELSGGQQQRTAIARALVKDSDLIFLDEPLANLDYKLREELRDELPKLFEGKNAIVFYATTEPHEALLFGGNTATLHEGRIVQYGETVAVYRQPNSLLSAEVFSDPPVNVARVKKRGRKLELTGANDLSLPSSAQGLADGTYDVAIRPHHVIPNAKPIGTDTVINGHVLVAEISGSESVIHFDFGGKTWVSQSPGVQSTKVGSAMAFNVDLRQANYFKETGERVL